MSAAAAPRPPARALAALALALLALFALLAHVAAVAAAPLDDLASPDAARVSAASPLDDLASPDAARVSAAVSAIEAGPPDADAWFAAARACEAKLSDPARALALYERIRRDLPDAGVAVPAGRRIAALRAELGANNEFAPQAAAFAALVASADARPAADIARDGDALAAVTWPGAADVALWLARWSRRRGALDDAASRFAATATRFPSVAVAARSEGAAVALEQRDWSRAEALASALPVSTERSDLLTSAARGRQGSRWYLEAWIVFSVALLALLASYVDARRRTRATRRRAPLEVLVLGPLALALALYTFWSDPQIAGFVTAVALGGVSLAWLSGAALDLARSRLRILAHLAITLLAALALLYIALWHFGLVDVVTTTVHVGPGA
ncbi:MAG TPA: hypothetical protein VGM88_26890 [Kofleriaceae bacterium]